MKATWKNWSGSLKFTPQQIAEPENEDELCELYREARKKGMNVRVAGAGHSSSPLVHTRALLVSLKKFRSVSDADAASRTAWVGAGTTVKDAGRMLLEHQLSLHNTGDVDVQTLVGAICTGTHGSGITLQNLSSMLVGCRMLCAGGEIKEFSAEQDGQDLFRAFSVSLGAFGIFTRVKVKLVPAFKLRRTEWCTTTRECLDHLDELISANRNFDFYWYPRSDTAKIRTLNETNHNVPEPRYAEKVEDRTGWAIDVLPKERQLRFEEMEYAVPLVSGPACFLEVRDIIKKNFRKEVAWRVLYRTVKSDDFYLSPCSGRDTVTISLHHNAGMPFWDFFKTIEPVFLRYSGKPHWGKKHTLRGGAIRSLYPGWNDFLKHRNRLDPEGIFSNCYLQNLARE